MRENPERHASINTILKTKLVNRILNIIWVMVTIALFFASREVIEDDNSQLFYFIYIPVFLLLTVITYRRSLNIHLRSGVISFLFFIIAMSELLTYGIASQTFMFFSIGVGLTAVMFNLKTGYIALIASMIIIIVAGALYSSGFIPLLYPQQQASIPWISWVSPVLSYLVTTASLITAMGLIIRDLLYSNQRSMTLIETRNRDISSAVEESSRNNTIVSVQKTLLRMFHKLNTPIGNALTMVSHLDDQLQDNKADTDAVKLILQSLKHASSEIEKMKALTSYLDTDSKKQEALDLCAFTMSHENLLQSFTTAEIIMTYETTGVIVEIDPLVFMEVLKILINNATDHSGITDTRIEIVFQTANTSELIVSVTDNGPGIKKADKERIFQPFYSNSGYHRMGLGLSLARKITEEQLHGKLTLDTDYHEGARFVLHIDREVSPGASL